jgi:hypothetical protein
MKRRRLGYGGSGRRPAEVVGEERLAEPGRFDALGARLLQQARRGEAETAREAVGITAASRDVGGKGTRLELGFRQPCVVRFHGGKVESGLRLFEIGHDAGDASQRARFDRDRP